MRACVLAVLSIVLWNLPVLAQQASGASGPRLVAHWSEVWAPPALRSTDFESASARLSRGTKWALGGGAVVGLLSAATANALCERSDGCTGPTLTWGVIGAGVGAVLGALIATATD